MGVFPPPLQEKKSLDAYGNQQEKKKLMKDLESEEKEVVGPAQGGKLTRGTGQGFWSPVGRSTFWNRLPKGYQSAIAHISGMLILTLLFGFDLRWSVRRRRWRRRTLRS